MIKYLDNIIYMQNSDIQKYKSNFYKVFHEQVLPALSPLEDERLRKRKLVIIISAIITIIALAIGIIIFLCSYSSGEFDLGFIGGALVVFFGALSFVYSWQKKSFEKHIKEKIMPILLPAFGNFRWTDFGFVSEYELKESQVIPYFEKIKVDDNFAGSYKNVPIKISEMHLTYEARDSKGRRHERTAFKGIVIVLEIPKRFSGHTIVKEKVLINSGPYKEVKLEDPEFSKKFHVRSSDQIEARILLTPSFMERYKNIQHAFSAKTINCSFLGQRLLLAIPVYKDLFALGDLTKPVTDTKQYEIFLEELISIFEIIEELKLYENTGL